MGHLPKCLNCKKKSKMVKFTCPAMTHHYKCMNCHQCYSLNMSKISQPPRTVEVSSQGEKADAIEESGESGDVETEEPEPYVMVEDSSPEIELASVELVLKDNETESLSAEEAKEASEAAQEIEELAEIEEEHDEVDNDDDDIEVITFQDLLPRRDAVVHESDCSHTKKDLENALKKTNELLLMFATVLFYAGYAVPYGSQQVSPFFTNVLNPLRQYRHSLWNTAQKKAHDHNSLHCIPQPEVIAKRISSLTVAVGTASAVHQKNKGKLLYSSFLPRNFNVIMSLENVPAECDKKEFRHQSKYHLMDSNVHQVYFSEQFSVGTIYSLDTVYSIRMFLDTTVLAAGKTTQVGKFEIPIRELVARGACDRVVFGTFRLENSKYFADIDLSFKLVTVEESEELKVMHDLEATIVKLNQRLAVAASSNDDTIRL